MAYKTRRQQRYVGLREAGFLPFEAAALSKVPVKPVPYMKALIADRRKMLKQATRQKMTKTGWERQIKKLYADSKWLTTTGKADPWQMLRNYEDRWKNKHPAYDSPWQKRRKSWQDFIRKAERTIAKQRAESDALAAEFYKGKPT